MSKYQVKLLDQKGLLIGSEREADNLKEARGIAKYLLSPEYAARCETSHELLGTEKVEVLDAFGCCVFDAFLQKGQL